MSKGIIIALVIIIVLVIIGAVVAYRSKNGTLMTFLDGAPVSIICPAEGGIDILSAQYGPTDGSTAAVDVMPVVEAALEAVPPKPLTVSAANLGMPALRVPGQLTIKYRCVGSVPSTSAARSAFQNIPFISCDRSADNQYAVDATVRNGTAMVWAPYVLGANFEEAPKKHVKEGYHTAKYPTSWVIPR